MSWILPTEFMSTQPIPPSPEVLKRAEILGTLNKIDRTPQYRSDDHAKPEKLLEAVNVQGNHIRGVQKTIGQVQRDLYNLKLRNALIVSVATALLMRAPEISVWVWRFFRLLPSLNRFPSVSRPYRRLAGARIANSRRLHETHTWRSRGV